MRASNGEAHIHTPVPYIFISALISSCHVWVDKLDLDVRKEGLGGRERQEVAVEKRTDDIKCGSAKYETDVLALQKDFKPKLCLN